MGPVTWTEVAATAAAHLIPLLALYAAQVRHERRCLEALRIRGRR